MSLADVPIVWWNVNLLRCVFPDPSRQDREKTQRGS